MFLLLGVLGSCSRINGVLLFCRVHSNHEDSVAEDKISSTGIAEQLHTTDLQYYLQEIRNTTTTCFSTIQPIQMILPFRKYTITRTWRTTVSRQELLLLHLIVRLPRTQELPPGAPGTLSVAQDARNALPRSLYAAVQRDSEQDPSSTTTPATPPRIAAAATRPPFPLIQPARGGWKL